MAVVTGFAPHSIAAAVVRRLLAGGATVVATSSRLTHERLDFAKRVYREHASAGARLWMVPANLASYRDVDATVGYHGLFIWYCDIKTGKITFFQKIIDLRSFKRYEFIFIFTEHFMDHFTVAVTELFTYKTESHYLYISL